MHANHYTVLGNFFGAGEQSFFFIGHQYDECLSPNAASGGVAARIGRVVMRINQRFYSRIGNIRPLRIPMFFLPRG